MRNYWTRILLGALGVFVVGMLGIAVARFTATRVHRAVAAAGPLALSAIPFRLDGERVGTISGLDARREPGVEPPQVRLTVDLDDPAVATRLADCGLAVQRVDQADRGATLHCDGENPGAAGLEPIGEVTFKPVGLVRPILVPVEEARRWRGQNGPDVERVHLRADSTGMLLHVADAKDRPLVHFRADSTGAVLRIKDDSDRVVVNFRADSTGLVFDVFGDSARAKRARGRASWR